jgi:hypothetical protein
VDGRHRLGAGDVEHLVAALMLGPPKVVGGEPGALEAGAGGAVVDNHPLRCRRGIGGRPGDGGSLVPQGASFPRPSNSSAMSPSPNSTSRARDGKPDSGSHPRKA